MDQVKTADNPLLSILIPAYNESVTIEKLLDKICSVDLGEVNREILVIDDASTDRTVSVVEKYSKRVNGSGIRLYTANINRGKGAALRIGIREAKGDYIIIQDADLEYDPGDYPRLLTPLLNNEADIVYGSRFMGSNQSGSFFFWQYRGNRILTWLSNIMTGLDLTDMETCYKLFRSDILKQLQLRESRFGFEPEVTARISKIKGARICEVPISYHGRNYGEGKKIGWMDGIRAIYCIIRYNLFSRKV